MARSTPGTSASKGSAQTIPNRGFRPPPISRPMPRPPMRPTYGSGATNFYRRPSYSYGVPTGLSALLSGQQSPFGRMVDPATGFPQRSFPRPVMGRPDFGQIGRSTSSGKSGSKGGARTVNPESQAVVDEYNRNPDPTLGESLPPPTYGTVTGLPSGLTPEQARLRQEELASRTGGGFSRLAPRRVSDGEINLDSFRRLNPQIETGEGFISTPIPAQDFTGAPPPMMDASQYLRAGGGGRGVPPILTQGLPERPDLIPARPARSVSQTPEESLRQRALAGNRRGTGLDLPPVSPSDVQQQIMRQIQMEQDGGRPNIRPTMNVGKATGGPVGIHSGIASLVGRR